MDLGQALEFVRQRREAVLATIKPDGRPQLSNIFYVLGDEGVATISVTDSRAKTVNLRRDPRASLHVAGDDFFHYVVLEGEVTLSPVAADPNDETVDQLVAYYRAGMGEEHPNWDEFRAAMVNDGRLVLHFHPSRAYGIAGER